MPAPIGQYLVQSGVLTPAQVDQIAAMQRTSRRPFGELAEQCFGIPARDVEDAWAAQYSQITRWVEPLEEATDSAALELVSRRQAWQFGVMPLRMEHGELLICTTTELLVRALNFTSAEIPHPCYFLLATPEYLAQALSHHYAMDGMDSQILLRGAAMRRAG